MKINSFGLLIKSLRKQQKLSQNYLADSLNIDRTLISRIETGGNLPSIKLLIQLSNALLIPSEYLIEVLKNEQIEHKLNIKST